MDKLKVFKLVKKILAGLLEAKDSKNCTTGPEIELESDLYTDLGLDSLELLDLLTAIEEEFGIDPDQYEAAAKRKVSEVVDYIIQLLEEKSDGIKK